MNERSFDKLSMNGNIENEKALYLGSSIKGESDIDWADKRARAALLTTIVADADRLLEVARQEQGALPEGSPEREGNVAAAELLG